MSDLERKVLELSKENGFLTYTQVEELIGNNDERKLNCSSSLRRYRPPRPQSPRSPHGRVLRVRFAHGNLLRPDGSRRKRAARLFRGAGLLVASGNADERARWGSRLDRLRNASCRLEHGNDASDR